MATVDNHTVILADLPEDEKEKYFQFLISQPGITFSRDVNGQYVANVRIQRTFNAEEKSPKKKRVPVHESRRGSRPPQEMARIEGALGRVDEGTFEFACYPKFSSLVTRRDQLAPKWHPLAWSMRFIEEVYDSRYIHDMAELRGDASPSKPPSERLSHLFPVFVVDFMSKRYGLRKLVDQNCWDLLYNIHNLRKEHLEVEIFSRFLEEFYDPDDLLFFLYVRSVIQKELGINFRNRWSELGRGRERAPQAVYLSYRECVVVARVVFGSEGDPLFRAFISMIEQHVVGARRQRSDTRRLEVTQFLHLAVVEYHETRPGGEGEGGEAGEGGEEGSMTASQSGGDGYGGGGGGDSGAAFTTGESGAMGGGATTDDGGGSSSYGGGGGQVSDYANMPAPSGSPYGSNGNGGGGGGGGMGNNGMGNNGMGNNGMGMGGQFQTPPSSDYYAQSQPQQQQQQQPQQQQPPQSQQQLYDQATASFNAQLQQPSSSSVGGGGGAPSTGEMERDLEREARVQEMEAAVRNAAPQDDAAAWAASMLARGAGGGPAGAASLVPPPSDQVAAAAAQRRAEEEAAAQRTALERAGAAAAGAGGASAAAAAGGDAAAATGAAGGGLEGVGVGSSLNVSQLESYLTTISRDREAIEDMERRLDLNSGASSGGAAAAATAGAGDGAAAAAAASSSDASAAPSTSDQLYRRVLLKELGECMQANCEQYLSVLMESCARLPAEVVKEIETEVKLQLERKVDAVLSSLISSARAAPISAASARAHSHTPDCTLPAAAPSSVDALLPAFHCLLCRTLNEGSDNAAAAPAGVVSLSPALQADVSALCRATLQMQDIRQDIEPLVALLATYASTRLEG